MKNFFKARIAPLFGIIALVVVIGFSMTACGGGDGGGGNPGGSISWAGTWKMEGGDEYDTFTLGANGAGWGSGGNPVSTENGRVWKTDDNFLSFGPALLFQQIWNGTLSTMSWYYYERISNTKIRITQGGNGDNSFNGVWEKQ